ncbi:unnamed protein product (macronuclear) [Paramecium tetraurelia]|uniref:Uncharacterized protein n=1 Tax=Paramecium tetraurelia TaxID=5888 RepID=A0BZ86_PARTE|nr:uncharacterized protein GSPATT00033706001 [Paramecium tetraurelia]CAK63853.1 unnamed protein product [Paramecium tetraurelia]|eukprot:XP_001431251.1 hypothetical protein (macronuclear) [Paramecium tetraurelia strain d4-2]
MKKQYGNSFILDTSIGMNNTIYLSPNTKNTMTNSFSMKTDIYDQNLQCNLFLFLSIVHGNHQLNKLFIQRCGNKDKFLQMLDTLQYSTLLTKVLQIVNQYFTETQSQTSEQQPNSNNKSWYSSDQKPTQKQGSNDKFQSMIKKIVTTDVDPLKSLINRVQEQNQSQYLSSSKLTSTSQLSNKLSEKLMKTNILKDQLKEKITKLAMQNSQNQQYKIIKTESDAQTYPTLMRDTPNQTISSKEPNFHKPNRISFGQQQMFNVLNDDQIIEQENIGTNQYPLIDSSPKFLHHQFKDHTIQTSETKGNVYLQNDLSNDHSLDLTQEKSRRFEGTFGKVKNRNIKNRKKSNSVSGNLSPQRSDRYNHEIVSIDQIQHKRKISINSVNRRYNILTNEQLQ